ncbi:MAG TPA: hypothetical protein VF877_03420 [Gaiellaceae bacterium]
MGRLVVLGLTIAFLLVSSGAAEGDHWLRYEQRGLGLSVSHPPGWQPILHHLTDCSNPVEVIDLGGPGRSLFMLQETGTRGLPRRPGRFRLVGEPSPLECCAPTSQPGWVLPFQDAGRGFYAYLYAGSLDRRSEVLGILNSLKVTPR